MSVVIGVPYRSDGGVRDASFAFVRRWWADRFPDWPLFVGVHGPEEGPFNRSAACNRAIAQAGAWDVALIVDGDVIPEERAVREAVELAADGAGMVLPFRTRRDLNRHGTSLVLDGKADPSLAVLRRYVRRIYAQNVSSVVAVSRGLWERVGGYDEAFVGWGMEDNAFEIACEAHGGPLRRISGTVLHLWHPSPAMEPEAAQTVLANRARKARYESARGSVAAVSALRIPISDGRIPRILHRTVPEHPSVDAERYWDVWMGLLAGWEFRDWRDPLDPADFPETSPLWPLCESGAQLADLVRLEALWRHGGVYVDSDVEPYRSLEPLLMLPAFAAWEDAEHVPNAVMGAAPGHPAIRACLDLAMTRVPGPTWHTGPGVTTLVLPGRADVLLLPPGSFYPYHYRDAKRLRGRPFATEQPWCFGAHHWAGSWLPEGKRW